MPHRRITFATKADIPAMLAIYRPYVEESTVSFETRAPDEEEFARRLQEGAQNFPWLVCQEGAQRLGYAYAARFGARSGYDWTVTTSVYVDAQAHKSGVGRALYTALFGLLQKQGCRRAYALIVTPNAESEGFHQKMGFEKEAVLHHVGCKFGRWLDVAYYAKPLGAYEENPPPPLPIGQLPPGEVDAILGGCL